ncbi:MAG TPA: hypothetical protein VFF52_29140, partial [Isosphaeraceae bacterium]|nr:hypothetical protein [Isosphaeraceae bacterium]
MIERVIARALGLGIITAFDLVLATPRRKLGPLTISGIACHSRHSPAWPGSVRRRVGPPRPPGARDLRPSPGSGLQSAPGAGRNPSESGATIAV